MQQASGSLCRRYTALMTPEVEAAYRLGGVSAALDVLPGDAFVELDALTIERPR